MQLPVLMLTALGTTDDIVLGLQAGADDYMVKPFKFTELLARISALLRRVESYRQAAPLASGDLSIDAATHKARRQDREVDLSTKEYRLLEYLMRHEGETLTRRQLLRDVWDKDFDTNTNVVDVYVRYLRQKIDEGFDRKLIHTIVGTGYRFGKEDDDEDQGIRFRSSIRASPSACCSWPDWCFISFPPTTSATSISITWRRRRTPWPRRSSPRMSSTL
jgi:DNA-binding response OmpR family regulator